MTRIFAIAITVALSFTIAGCQSSGTQEKDNKDLKQEKKKLSENSIEGLTQAISNDTANADLYHRRARLQYQNTNLNRAINDIGEAIRLEPDKDRHLILLSEIYEAMNKFKDAKGVLTRVANRNQKNLEANLKLSRLELAYKNYQQAIIRANRALDIDPENAEAFYLKGYIYQEQGDTVKAIDHYMRSVDKNPQFQDPYLQLGNIFADKGDTRAVDFYNGALNMNPDDVQTMYLLAIYYQGQEKLDKAMRTYRNILAVDSTHAKSYYNIGYLKMIYAEDFDEAIKFFDKAIDHQPGFYQAYYNRGYTYELKEKYQQARADYQYALKLKPNYDKAVEGMNRLDNVIY